MDMVDVTTAVTFSCNAGFGLSGGNGVGTCTVDPLGGAAQFFTPAIDAGIMCDRKFLSYYCVFKCLYMYVCYC